MIYSLRTPKQRIETASGANFFNDFSNTLHMFRDDKDLVLALNLGTSNWTVSDADEAACYVMIEGEPRLVIIDTNTMQRKILPVPKEQYNVTDLLITKDRYYAAIPGLLITGNRAEDGRLLWNGAKAIDLGAGYRFVLEDDGRLAYTKRGTCNVFRYDPLTKKKEETPTPKRLWEMLFNHDFMPEYMPPFPGGGFPSIEEFCDAFADVAAQHNVVDVGVRVYAILAFLRQFDVDTADVLNRLLSLDWEMQYTQLIDEPFPSVLLFHKLFDYKSPEDIPKTKLMHRKMVRWSRLFETSKDFAKRARLVRSNQFEDVYLK